MEKIYYFNGTTQLKDSIQRVSRVIESKQLIKLINCFKEISEDYCNLIPENQYFKKKYDFYNELFHELDCICTKEYNSRFD